ncbi:putative methyltransferase [Sedimentisphaera cyanobacteriorum]|uniref:Putative methyltransferase n=1 Tax=Sedimentisphaera cyanobacteriorum TaxID=1940790 RepID=A0A1Q2HPE9_9BACT|nr:DNA methyltransferase [Sedimentisphaera cyanobacteriorum]AQQ09298.1 putative methyltransferase [Sedimentisphaera cyanobacteriorum]
MPEKPKSKSKKQRFEKPSLQKEVTTLWDYPSQNYGGSEQGDTSYIGATPSYVIWNLLQRYTKKNDLAVDPMCGSGTTLDVARDLGRRALGYDVNPTRPDIFNVDARKLPLEDEKADFVFIDPPYSTHINYSDDPRCIGKLHAGEKEYYDSMRQVLAEIHRILKPGKFFGLYVCDSFELKKGFFPIGFELFAIMREKFTPKDIVSVVRHNKTLEMGNYRKAADEQNFFLRGFNYLFIMQKPQNKKPANPRKMTKRKRPAKNSTRPASRNKNRIKQTKGSPNRSKRRKE